MLYIQKRMEPPAQRAKRIEIQHSDGWKSAVLGDTEIIRDYFNQLPKSEIRDSLIKEQKGLCAYCMRRLDLGGAHVRNLGRLNFDTQIGSYNIRDLVFFAPKAPGSYIVLGIATLNDTMQIGLSFDRKIISPEIVNELKSNMVALLLKPEIKVSINTNYTHLNQVDFKDV